MRDFGLLRLQIPLRSWVLSRNFWSRETARFFGPLIFESVSASNWITPVLKQTLGSIARNASTLVLATLQGTALAKPELLVFCEPEKRIHPHFSDFLLAMLLAHPVELQFFVFSVIFSSVALPRPPERLCTASLNERSKNRPVEHFWGECSDENARSRIGRVPFPSPESRRKGKTVASLCFGELAISAASWLLGNGAGSDTCIDLVTGVCSGSSDTARSPVHLTSQSNSALAAARRPPARNATNAAGIKLY